MTLCACSYSPGRPLLDLPQDALVALFDPRVEAPAFVEIRQELLL